MQSGAKGSESSRDNVLGLTALRGLAAFYVMLYHYREFLPSAWLDAASAVSGIPERGYLAVDFFFVLSGFVIAHVHMNDFRGRIGARGVGRFLALRLSRIYPLHVVTLVAMVILALGWELLRWHHTGEFGWMPWAGRYSLKESVRNLFLLQGGFAVIHSWNFPAWSIGAEWFAYLAFPFLALAASRPIGKWAVPCGGLILILWLLWERSGAIGVASGYGWPLARCLGEFMIGMGIFIFARRRALNLRVARTAVWIFAGALCAGLQMGIPDIGFLLLAVALISAIVMAPDDAVSIFSRSWMDWLGERSYSIYMVHALVSFAGERFFAFVFGPLPEAADMQRFALWAAMICFSVLLSDFAYRRIEIPARKWGRYSLSHASAENR